MRHNNEFDPWNENEKEIIRRMKRRTENIITLLLVGSIVGFVCRLILG